MVTLIILQVYTKNLKHALIFYEEVLFLQLLLKFRHLRMIQRIQTIYLFFAAVIAVGLPFVVSLWKTAGGIVVMALDEPLFLAAFLLSGFLAFAAIFLFKNRQLQTVLNRLNIILNFILLGVFVYRSLTVSGDEALSEKGIGMLIPIFSIVLLVLANKAIRKDELLVKSADRLR